MRAVRDAADRVRHGLSRTNHEDWRDVIRTHRRIFERLKREQGVGFGIPTPTGEAWPELIASVCLLWEYGYSKSDIGAMFGVSRERVRQWLGPYGEGHKRGALLRLWNDEENCFTPVTAQEYRQRQARRDKRVWQENAEWRWALKVKAVGKTLGRSPTLTEVAEYLGRDRVVLAPVMAAPTRNLRGCTHTEALDWVWSRAGYVRPDGRRKYGNRWRKHREER